MSWAGPPALASMAPVAQTRSPCAPALPPLSRLAPIRTRAVPSTSHLVLGMAWPPVVTIRVAIDLGAGGTLQGRCIGRVQSERTGHLPGRRVRLAPALLVQLQHITHHAGRPLKE